MGQRLNFLAKADQALKNKCATDYKGIYKVSCNGGKNIYYTARITVKKQKFRFSGDSARAVALELDKKLIAKGLEPINILKRKI